MRMLLIAGAFLVSLVAHGAPPASKSAASMTIVVFNSNAPDSEKLARLYAAKRGLAAEQIVGLACTPAEEISRVDYERDIAEPLRAIFKKRGWWRMKEAGGQVESSRIRFVALMRGIPLR
ncbi:MAG: TIGR03790 family protein, partial [Verrucomicrobiota bacterium]